MTTRVGAVAPGQAAQPSAPARPAPLGGPEREAFEAAMERTRPGTAPVRIAVVRAAIAAEDEAGLVDHPACAELLRRAAAMARDLERGATAEALAAQASALFDDLQGRLLTRSTAADLRRDLERTLAGLRTSPAYAQGPVIPPAQSEAEGQIARSLDLLAIAAKRTGVPLRAD